MAEPISIKQTIVVRSRPDVLYRLALEPKRRLKWDPNLVQADYEGEGAASATTRWCALSSRAACWGCALPPSTASCRPQRGGWESVRHVGPLEKLTQSWVFRPMPGGTEVTLTVNARVRYKFVKAPVERILHNMVATTLLELQRSVDAQGAQLLEDMGRELQERQKADKKAAKEAAKAAKRKK
ncbi:SRPBCC family protein [Deinococcus multiflagellatus]|uniref:SRPBCC family protein n=1 Tax=Deinococcus multiflagellatus TaxID=1656887 RepID=A0ABW1ZLE5_9DEIO